MSDLLRKLGAGFTMAWWAASSAVAGMQPSVETKCHEQVLRPNRPITVRLGIQTELGEGLFREIGPTARLTIADVRPSDQRLGLRVFVDAPDADAETPISDPHYVGSVSFLAPAKSVFLNAAPALRRLYTDGQKPPARSTFTFVLPPVRTGKPVDDAVIYFGCVSLELK